MVVLPYLDFQLDGRQAQEPERTLKSPSEHLHCPQLLYAIHWFNSVNYWALDVSSTGAGSDACFASRYPGQAPYVGRITWTRVYRVLNPACSAHALNNVWSQPEFGFFFLPSLHFQSVRLHQSCHIGTTYSQSVLHCAGT
jgi:hypothetical protein